ncbi:hypothetical protein EDD22DRAFT_922442 [Suillus occidentalis]|nr:hypothetical protein EDD22DRAFT_922442 [Suillus occidentalis]
MSTAIEAPLPRAPTPEFNLLDAQANGSQAADPSPLPCQPLHTNRHVTIIQNIFAENTTINIDSTNCHGSTVTRLYRDVAGTASAESTSSQLPMLARLSEPVQYCDGRENIILNGNTFGSHVMINIGSHHCTGAGGAYLFLATDQLRKLSVLIPQAKHDTVVEQGNPFDSSLSQVLCGLHDPMLDIMFLIMSLSFCNCFVSAHLW